MNKNISNLEEGESIGSWTSWRIIALEWEEKSNLLDTVR